MQVAITASEDRYLHLLNQDGVSSCFAVNGGAVGLIMESGDPEKIPRGYKLSARDLCLSSCRLDCGMDITANIKSRQYCAASTVIRCTLCFYELKKVERSQSISGKAYLRSLY